MILNIVSCGGSSVERRLHAAAVTCIPNYLDVNEAFKIMDSSMQSQGFTLKHPSGKPGWLTKHIATDGGYNIKLLGHCIEGNPGLQLLFIEGSTKSFSLEGWSRWYAVNELLEELLMTGVVLERHPWFATPDDEDVIRYAQILDVRLPSDAIKALVERGAGTEEELVTIGRCRVIGDPADYPGC